MERLSSRSANVLVSSDAWRAFRVRCLQQGKSASEVLGELVDRYLAEDGKSTKGVKSGVSARGNKGDGSSAVRRSPGASGRGRLSKGDEPSGDIRGQGRLGTGGDEASVDQ